MKISAYAGLGATILAVAVGLPMALHEPAEWARPAGPSLADMGAQEITFRNGELTLAGVMISPDGEPSSASVIIHGSGTSRRDNGWYLELADILRRSGHLVLLPDKRGSERSGGDWRSASMEDLAGDTEAAVAFLRARQPQLPVGIVGVSQGGWVASITAENDATLSYVANLSGSAVPATEQLVLEETNTMHEEMGVPRWLAGAIAPLTAWNTRNNVQPEIWDSLNSFNAADHWARVNVPVFSAYGALDEFDNVPVARSVAALEGLGNPHFTTRVYDRVGHGYFFYDTGEMHPDFVADFIAFLDANSR